MWKPDGPIKFVLEASYLGSSLKEQQVGVISSKKMLVGVVCVDIQIYKNIISKMISLAKWT